MQSASSRQQILEAIANLSDQQLSIVLKFIQTLQPNPSSTSAQFSIDPLASFIGANNHGNLAHAIDATLYD
ncbi:MAG: hypothetical protein HC866_26915 [Leptolyngbyaceae cyanobacterium RU_5_1]|nr:hypothetical protein [Leptolyngbyaceae cyanobacterium RU_5_1]